MCHRARRNSFHLPAQLAAEIVDAHLAEVAAAACPVGWLEYRRATSSNRVPDFSSDRTSFNWDLVETVMICRSTERGRPGLPRSGKRRRPILQTWRVRVFAALGRSFQSGGGAAVERRFPAAVPRRKSGGQECPPSHLASARIPILYSLPNFVIPGKRLASPDPFRRLPEKRCFQELGARVLILPASDLHGRRHYRRGPIGMGTRPRAVCGQRSRSTCRSR